MTLRPLTEHPLELLCLKWSCIRLFWVYSMQNATLLEISCRGYYFLSYTTVFNNKKWSFFWFHAYVQGRVQDVWKGGSYIKRCGGSFCWFYLIFFSIPWKWNNLVSVRPNYFIYIEYLKNGGGGGVARSPLNPLWILHWGQNTMPH